MTPRERSAFNADIEAVRQMALPAAVMLDIRENARLVRRQAAVATSSGTYSRSAGTRSLSFSCS